MDQQCIFGNGRRYGGRGDVKRRGPAAKTLHRRYHSGNVQSMNNPALPADEVERFLEQGYIVIPNAFDVGRAAAWIDRAWKRLGYDPNDSTTWAEARIHMPSLERVDVREFAPKVWAAACQLLGGEDRVVTPYTWGDSFIVNLSEGADRPWAPAGPEVKGWHKDGDFFLHFLDSPEQGLLTIVLWTDVVHQGGPTYIAPDSVGVIARYLAEHPEGVGPNDFNFRDLIRQCSQFVEATGKAGDVFLMHPYMLHAVSQNVLRRPRMITNPPIALKEPMNFNRKSPADHSPVERAVLRALGNERLDFKPTSPRKNITPDRVLKQAKMLEAEKARLAAMEK